MYGQAAAPEIGPLCPFQCARVQRNFACWLRLQVYKGVRRRVQEVAVKRLAPGTCHDEWLRRLQVDFFTPSDASGLPRKPAFACKFPAHTLTNTPPFVSEA